MILDVKFEESNQVLPVKFSEVHEVSDGGYEKGYADGCEVGEKEGYNKGFEQGTEQGYNDGYAKAESENPYQYATSLYNHFNNTVFPDGYELSLDSPNVSDLYSAFRNTKGVKKIVLKGNTNANALYCASCLQNSSVEEFDFTEFNMIPTSLQNFCNAAKKLQKLIGVIDMSSCTNTNAAFPDSLVFKEIRFKENTIGVSISFAWTRPLSAESVQSIIDGLATVETAQTLDFHADIVAKLTEEQWVQITDKNWSVL